MKKITKKQKKAQMKLGETIAVLIIFFLLLFFGIFFYSGIEKREFQQKITETQEKTSIDIAQTITFLPELKCTSEDIAQTLCIDILKAESFQSFSQQNSAYYYSIFGNTKIELIKIYSGSISTENIPIAPIEIYQGTESMNYFTTHMPITIFYPTPYPGRNGIGLLKITQYLFEG